MLLLLGGILLGLVLLVAGGELLVRGAVAAAEKLGVSPLVIGLTLVAFGTSMPEMAVSIGAVYSDVPGIFIGNIVGSNISNILLIIGLTALVMPIPVAIKTISRDGAMMVFATVVFVALAFISPLTRVVGLSFLGLLAAYLIFVWLQDRKEQSALATGNGDVPTESFGAGSILLSVLLALVGIAVVVAGAHILVDNAAELARQLGVPDVIIGLTIIAIGTSMPELVTGIIAAIKRESDIILGGILGSNIFNLFAIGGVTSAVAPEAVKVPEQVAYVDNFIMLAVTVLLLVFAYTRQRIGRFEGFLLFAAYVAYIAYIAIPELDGIKAAIEKGAT
ncbi:MAG: calcium/sodium antiporter [Pseudomonadota bacterium]